MVPGALAGHSSLNLDCNSFLSGSLLHGSVSDASCAISMQCLSLDQRHAAARACTSMRGTLAIPRPHLAAWISR